MFRHMNDWLNDRTDYRTVLNYFKNRTVPEGPKWGYSLAVCLFWLLAIQCVTGFLMMASYSPSSTTAWASVHFIEHNPAGGFIRGIHYFATQAMIVLFAVHIIRVLFTAAFRAPHEIVWATGLIMMPLVIVWAITGNPLSGSITGMSQIEVEGNILGSTPVIGPVLQRLLIGGSQVGHLTLTHLYFLHVALLPLIVVFLLGIHIWQIYRHGLAITGSAPDGSKACSYYPNQTIRNMVVLTMVLGAISFMAWRFGAPLEAPSDPQISHMPRPEWYFLFLFELRRYFVGDWEILATAVIPMSVLLFLLLLPFVDRLLPRRLSAALRFGVIVLGCGSWAGLTYASLARDAEDLELIASRQQLHDLAVRARELADHNSVPIEGPTSLLRNDARTQGPILFARHCGSCHSHATSDGRGLVADKPSAPNLHGFASRQWIAELLDPDRIGGDQFFGHTAFAEGDMVSTVVDLFDGVEGDERNALTEQLRQVSVALSAAAELPGQSQADAHDAEVIAAGTTLMTEELGCADCHKIGEAGELGSAPDLTGYGSRDWLISFVSNPGHERFYGAERNDRMPAFAPDSEHPGMNVIPQREIELIVDWLRHDWYEPDDDAAATTIPDSSSADKVPQIVGAD